MIEFKGFIKTRELETGKVFVSSIYSYNKSYTYEDIKKTERLELSADDRDFIVSRLLTENNLLENIRKQHNELFEEGKISEELLDTLNALTIKLYQV